MSEITPAQAHILQHALGLPTRPDPPAYRNRYVVGPDCDGFADCRALVEAGLMIDHGPRRIFDGMHCFAATQAGERIAREAWQAAQPRLTRAQRRYRQWLDADSGLTFGEWLRADRR